MGSGVSTQQDPKLKNLENLIKNRNVRLNVASSGFSEENSENIEKEFRESLSNLFSQEEKNNDLVAMLKIDDSQNYNSGIITTLPEILRMSGDDSLRDNILFTFRSLDRTEINTLSTLGINVSNRVSLANSNENPSQTISRSTSNPMLNGLGNSK